MSESAHCSCAGPLKQRIEELEEQLADIYESDRAVMDEPCPGDDRVHCTCVPALRKAAVEAERKLREFDGLRVVIHKEDGVWLHFTASDGATALIHVATMAEMHGGSVIRRAVGGWAADREAKYRAEQEEAGNANER